MAYYWIPPKYRSFEKYLPSSARTFINRGEDINDRIGSSLHQAAKFAWDTYVNSLPQKGGAQVITPKSSSYTRSGAKYLPPRTPSKKRKASSKRDTLPKTRRLTFSPKKSIKPKPDPPKMPRTRKGRSYSTIGAGHYKGKFGSGKFRKTPRR
ncbi:hypothetical protein [Circoviridae 9 LDMD-2013]|uniref:hypothetical protein n=1 Tax=Circoviridae 9 LDMD-2013 TaxID=1379713 RepID=UPI0003846F8A|nr:hypothetical protein [Circoviridae 9 LDMD-2013]AGS36204.1 hypothetical protein [Circoviridae 9 LDMD-2013]